MTYVRNQDRRTNPVINFLVGTGGNQIIMPPDGVTLAGAISVSVIPTNLIAALPVALGVALGDTTLLPTLAGSITVAVAAQTINVELCS